MSPVGAGTRRLVGCAMLGAWLLVSAASAFAAPPPAQGGGEGERGLKLVTDTEAAPVRRFWAVVVGVSEYRYTKQGIRNLDFAHKDARVLAGLMQGEAFGGGGIPAEQIRLLVNNDATLAKVRSALLDFLGKAGRDDMVIIFFAGHGTPDPSRTDEMYLLLHDSDPRKLASTALSMADVKRAVDRIRAERVVLFADACHSAGIVLPGTSYRSLSDHNPINTFLVELSKTRRSRVVVTSSDVNEKSQEGPKWGHGVFTWALINALKGAADTDKDGIVRLGEVLTMVRDRVEQESRGTQHPVVTGEVDARLPMAMVGDGVRRAPAPQVATQARPVRSARAKGKGPHFSLGEVTVQGRIQKPEVFFFLGRREFDVPLP
ncbi:MAG: caspase family protein, partial [Myxococcota bacterium]|nr:caspase family protein [Myxococcota bacterium]